MKTTKPLSSPSTPRRAGLNTSVKGRVSAKKETPVKEDKPEEIEKAIEVTSDDPIIEAKGKVDSVEGEKTELEPSVIDTKSPRPKSAPVPTQQSATPSPEQQQDILMFSEFTLEQDNANQITLVGYNAQGINVRIPLADVLAAVGAQGIVMNQGTNISFITENGTREAMKIRSTEDGDILDLGLPSLEHISIRGKLTTFQINHNNAMQGLDHQGNAQNIASVSSSWQGAQSSAVIIGGASLPTAIRSSDGNEAVIVHGDYDPNNAHVIWHEGNVAARFAAFAAESNDDKNLFVVGYNDQNEKVRISLANILGLVPTPPAIVYPVVVTQSNNQAGLTGVTGTPDADMLNLTTANDLPAGIYNITLTAKVASTEVSDISLAYSSSIPDIEGLAFDITGVANAFPTYQETFTVEHAGGEITLSLSTFGDGTGAGTYDLTKVDVVIEELKGAVNVPVA